MINNTVTRLPYISTSKVLPLAYDDTLSYYEVLAKVVQKTNEIVDFIDGQFPELFAEYANLMLPEVLYDVEHERLTLLIEPSVRADGEHVYTPNDETMTIE